MTHAFLYLIFIFPFTAWLGHELKRSYSLTLHWRWIAATFAVGVAGAATFKLKDDMFGNFLLHASGGVAASLMFVYLLKTLQLRFNWRLETVLMFGFVSALGVLNELAEYALEFVGLGPFSFDKHDTWRDLVANTTGAFICWGVVYLLHLRKSIR